MFAKCSRVYELLFVFKIVGYHVMTTGAIDGYVLKNIEFFFLNKLAALEFFQVVLQKVQKAGIFLNYIARNGSHSAKSCSSLRAGRSLCDIN